MKTSSIRKSAQLNCSSITGLLYKRFGFRKGQRTIGAVSDFINIVAWGLDESQCTTGVFCGLSKAAEGKSGIG